jgi:hypothetical protein
MTVASGFLPTSPNDDAVALGSWLVPSTSTGDLHPQPTGHAGRTKQKAAPGAAFETKNRRRPTLPGPRGPSTIGAKGLNFSVRNGKRCFPLATATGKWREKLLPGLQNRTVGRRQVSRSVKPSKH